MVMYSVIVPKYWSTFPHFLSHWRSSISINSIDGTNFNKTMLMIDIFIKKKLLSLFFHKLQLHRGCGHQSHSSTWLCQKQRSSCRSSSCCCCRLQSKWRALHVISAKIGRSKCAVLHIFGSVTIVFHQNGTITTRPRFRCCCWCWTKTRRTTDRTVGQR